MKYDEYVKSNDTPMDLCMEIDNLKAENDRLQKLSDARGNFIDFVLANFPDCINKYLELDKVDSDENKS